MQDRFEFRGLSKGKWYYGAYFKHLPYTPYCCGGKPPEKDYKHLIIQEGFSDWGLPRSMTCIEVEKDTVGQCTGLKDKKGKLIYEGDIVDCYVSSKKIYRYQIKQEIGSFMLVSPKKEIYDFINKRNDNVYPLSQLYFEYENEENCIEQCEVIGNIYENKDLLAKENKQ